MCVHPGPETESHSLSDYTFDAGTTAMNAQRLLRALKLRRPVLLEGSPGVGKTSLVAALAKASGNHLVRINLSEQTVMIRMISTNKCSACQCCNVDDNVKLFSPIGCNWFVWDWSPCGGGQGRRVCMARWPPFGCSKGRSLGCPRWGKDHYLNSFD